MCYFRLSKTGVQHEPVKRNYGNSVQAEARGSEAAAEAICATSFSFLQKSIHFRLHFFYFHNEFEKNMTVKCL